MADIRRVIAASTPIGVLQTLSNGDELRSGHDASVTTQ